MASAALMLGGGVLRCVHLERGSAASSLLMHAGQVVNGLAGPVAMSIGAADAREADRLGRMEKNSARDTFLCQNAAVYD